MKFYIAEGEAREKLLNLHKQRMKVMKDRHALSKRFKADGCVTVGNNLAGLVFRVDPPAPWVFSKRLSKHVAFSFVPDQSKEGKAIKAEFAGLEDKVNGWTVGAAVGIAMPLILGRSFYMPRFVILCGKVVVGLDEDHKPKGCRRISDVEYEKLLAKESLKEPKPKRHEVGIQ